MHIHVILNKQWRVKRNARILCVCVSVHITLCVCVYIRVCVCVYCLICITCVHLRVFLGVCVYVYPLCVGTYTHCVCVQIPILCVCVYARVRYAWRVCSWEYLKVCVCTSTDCACVCVFICSHYMKCMLLRVFHIRTAHHSLSVHILNKGVHSILHPTTKNNLTTCMFQFELGAWCLAGWSRRAWQRSASIAHQWCVAIARPTTLLVFIM